MDYKVVHTADPKMKKIMEIAEGVASSRAAVLIIGESGTGKELLARFIHTKSNRSNNRFVAINCAAVPENLLESELFGYEKGAFTGAQARKLGKIEQAHNSTFLLDEIGDMPLSLQAKLLRVIQEGEVERLGGTTPINVNVRFIATTHCDLADLVGKGQFREDLYYRLNVIPVNVPPLRRRPKDVELLASLFLEMAASENGLEQRNLTACGLKKLMNWSWPGNIRELQNVIERSLLMSASKELSENDLIINGYEQAMEEDELRAGMKVSEVERRLILKTLEHTNQNRTKAAELLGISIRTLRNKINTYREAQHA